MKSIENNNKDLNEELYYCINVFLENEEKILEKVQKLINKKADVNYKVKDSDVTILMKAVSHHLTDVIKLLIENGANVNAQDNGGWTALMNSLFFPDEIERKRATTVTLLQQGSDITIKNNNGQSAYDIALRRDNEDLAILIKKYEKKYIKYLINWKRENLRTFIKKKVPIDVAKIIIDYTKPTYIEWFKHKSE